jgi:hypothetical protein
MSVWDGVQLSVKLLMNSLYGFFGSPPDSPPAPAEAANRRLRRTPKFSVLDEQVITRPDFRVLTLESFLPLYPDWGLQHLGIEKDQLICKPICGLFPYVYLFANPHLTLMADWS